MSFFVGGSVFGVFNFMSLSGVVLRIGSYIGCYFFR